MIFTTQQGRRSAAIQPAANLAAQETSRTDYEDHSCLLFAPGLKLN
jgi:hypothetical protein